MGRFSILGMVLLLLSLLFPPSSPSMDGFRLVKLNEVIRQVDIVITCTGTWSPALGMGPQGCTPIIGSHLFPKEKAEGWGRQTVFVMGFAVWQATRTW